MDDDSVPTNLPDERCRMVRDEAALITAVDDSIIALLGWRRSS